MAPNFGKQISFSGLRRGASKKAKADYPEKRYINLAQPDERTIDIRRTIPTAIVVIILLALFAKFGVFDFYDRLNAKQSELAVHTSQLSTLQSQLTNYNAVLEEYEGYESMSLSGEGLVVNALDALRLVDTFIAPAANIASLSLTGDTLSLSLTNVNLDGVGQLASTLREQPMVKSVSVSTASTRNANSENVTAAMTIKLAPVQAE